MNVQVAVVGAGIAGLAAARGLHDAGFAVQVFDKGRGPGGRTSTRRARPGSFDHGAQYFTARSEQFRAATDTWLADAVVAEWSPRIRGAVSGDTASRRFVPQPAMNSLARHLSRGLSLATSVEIKKARRAADGWILHCAAGEVCRAGALILALPAPQVLPLVDGLAADTVANLTRVRFAPCWAVLAEAAEPDRQPPFDAAFVSAGPLSWVARQSARPGRSGAGWVLHGSAAFSQTHLAAEPEQVSALLTKDFQQRFGIALAPGPLAHRWRYARVTQPAGQRSYLMDAGTGLVMAGDWCAGDRIEDAYLSGVAAGQVVAATVQGARAVTLSV
jgi:predicted NAD/FAD-dependent oxidoreductase